VAVVDPGQPLVPVLEIQVDPEAVDLLVVMVDKMVLVEVVQRDKETTVE
jgi:hypothetical protein